MSGEPVLPAYGSHALSDLLPAVLAALGLPAVDRGAPPALRIEPARRVCLLLVDGLGQAQLERHAEHAPFLAGLLPGGAPLTAPFPSTTAVSLASLGTARPPGQHGLVGYQSLVPGTDRLLNALRWPAEVDPLTWQPHPTVFEQAARAGVEVAQVAPQAFAGTGLTVAALRGGRFLAAGTAGERAAVAARHVAESGEPSLTYVYYGDLDATGHRHGVDSPAWRLQLAHVDLLARQLARALPAGTLLLITADHGMVDTTPASRLDLAAGGRLTDGVRVVGGESRARHLYLGDADCAAVAAAWRDELGDRAWVRTRDEAIAEGWFGPRVDPAVMSRIGDVVVAARGDLALVHTRAEPVESGLVGVHGSMTADEMHVPLLHLTT